MQQLLYITTRQQEATHQNEPTHQDEATGQDDDTENTENSESLESELTVEAEPKLTEPGMYRVIMHNDHYTTMDFVVEVIMKIFHKPLPEATRIMLDIHKKGAGICGVFTYDIALTKVSEVHRMAKQHQFPLRCSYEEA
jgi:ATP-dependent Clp protease adaptor protein ClpS